MEDAEYRQLAAVEEEMWYFRALHALVERELARALGAGPAELLDAGCGTGGLIRRLSPRHPGWRWTGIDLSPVACGLSRERTGARIVEGGVEALPFGDEAFDAVVLADVIYHLDDDGAALRESFRVLRPGGLVVVNAAAYGWLWSYHDEAVHGRRRYSRSEVLGKLTAAGFGGARATYWNTLLFPLVVVRRKLLPPPKSGGDVRAYPKAVQRVGSALMALERAWLRRAALPFGTSVFAVARKGSER